MTARPFLPRPVAGNARGITYRGKRAYLGDVLAFNGIPRSTYYERIASGWDRALAMTEPVSAARSRSAKRTAARRFKRAP